MTKFILSENIKHILNEKYLLDERYILTEAADYNEIIIKWSIEVKKKIPDLKDKLQEIKKAISENEAALKDKESKADLSNLIKAEDDSYSKIETAKELPSVAEADTPSDEIKSTTYTYTTNLENLFNFLNKSGTKDPDVAALDKDIKELKKDTSTGAWTDEVQNKVLDLCQKIHSSITGILGKSEFSTEVSADTEVLDKISALCDETNKRIEKLDNEYLFTEKQTFNNTVAEKYLKILKDNLQPAINNILNFNTEEITKITADLFKDLSNAIASLANTVADLVQAEAESDDNDWEAQYKACTNSAEFEAFWTKYFKVEWKVKAQAVSDFGSSFIDDLKELGWNSATNPIIAFLKRPEIYKIIGDIFNKPAYISIHNAAARSQINKNDFLATDGSYFGKSNLIFNLNLYKNLTDIDEYLKAQARLIRENYNLSEPAKSLWKKGGRQTLLNNIMLKEGNKENLGDTSVHPGGPLRPISEVKTIMASLIGEESAEKPKATNATIDAIMNKVTDSDKEEFLAYIATYFLEEYQSQVNDIDLAFGNEIQKLTSKTAVAWKNIPKFNSWIRYDLDGKLVKLLLTKAAKRAGLTKIK